MFPTHKVLLPSEREASPQVRRHLCQKHTKPSKTFSEPLVNSVKSVKSSEGCPAQQSLRKRSFDALNNSGYECQPSVQVFSSRSGHELDFSPCSQELKADKRSPPFSLQKRFFLASQTPKSLSVLFVSNLFIFGFVSFVAPKNLDKADFFSVNEHRDRRRRSQAKRRLRWGHLALSDAAASAAKPGASIGRPF